jgi:pimeloyl-ACP methyl ester carboxylesterase
MLLAFDDVGPGPVVVLLHGFPLDRSMWEFQLAEIGSIYRVIAPDLRGSGSTAAPDGIYTVDLMADDVIDTLDALELDDPVVIGGLSMGGYVALSLALRYPERLRGLMLMNTRATADPPAVAKIREDLARELEATGKPDPVVGSMLPKLFAPITYVNHPELVDRVRERALRSNPRGLANTLRGLAVRPDRTAELARISVPTLVMAGAGDQLIPASDSLAMADRIPGSQLVTISEAGHLAPLENKAAANGVILDFLRELGD